MILAKILSILGLSGCALPPVAGERDKLREKSEKDELAILFIGNSYSFGVPAALKSLAESRGRKIRTGHSTYGGWSLAKHSRNPPTLKKMREGKWDIVVFQDYSMNPAMRERERHKIMDAGVQFFASEARALGCVPLLYQTWGRRDGNPLLPGDDFYKMNERVRNGYRAASRKAGGITTVAAGDAWEREYRAGRGKELFIEDGSHPSAFGNSVTAEEFFKTIYGR